MSIRCWPVGKIAMRKLDSHELSGFPAVTDDQYSTFRYDDQLVMYDSGHADRWLQSDTFVELAASV